jgi:hypothetical protein
MAISCTLEKLHPQVSGISRVGILFDEFLGVNLAVDPGGILLYLVFSPIHVDR